MTQSVVQQTPKASSGGATSVTLTFPGATTAGNQIVVTVSSWNGATHTISANDNKGNGAYSIDIAATANSSGGGSFGRATILSKIIATGGSSHTVTVTSTLGSTAFEANAFEVAQTLASSYLDQTASASGATSATPTTPATTQADEIVVACLCYNGGSSSATISDPPSGYTSIGVNQNSAATIGYEAAYKIVSATGAQSAAWTYVSVTDAATGVVATYKAVVGGATTTKIMSDTTTLSDAQVLWSRRVRRQDETLSLADTIVKAIIGSGAVTVKTMSDTLVLTEQVVDWLRRKRDGLDTILFTDDPNRVIQMIFDDVTGDLTDGLARSLSRGRVATESITLTDTTVLWRRLRRVMDESMALLDGFVKATAGSGTVYTKVMSEAIEYSDGFVRYLRYRRTATDNLDVLDAFSKILAGAGITYAKVMSDSVTLLDDAGNRWKYVRSQASDTLQLQDGSVSGALRPRMQTDAIAFADALTRWVRLVRQAGDTVEFTDGFVRIRSMVRSYSDSMGITDEAIRSLFFDQLQPTNFRLGVGSDPFRFGMGAAPF